MGAALEQAQPEPPRAQGRVQQELHQPAGEQTDQAFGRLEEVERVGGRRGVFEWVDFRGDYSKAYQELFRQLQAPEKEIAAVDPAEKRRLQSRLAELRELVRSEKLGEVADEFDRVHTVQRALAVGSLDRIIPAADLRPYVISAIERRLQLQADRQQ